MEARRTKTARLSIIVANQSKMDNLVGYLLMVGVFLSLTLITAGLVWRWLNTGHALPDYEIPRTNLLQFIVAEVRLAWQGELRPRLMLNLGIAVLMLTPFFRVAASMAYFLVVERNWKYACFTGFVLATLSYSLLIRA